MSKPPESPEAIPTGPRLLDESQVTESIGAEGLTASATELATVPAEAYEFSRDLASGGMGHVYEARDLRLGRAVAIKELLPEARRTEARFIREALVTARLEHPGIVPVHEAGRWPSGQPFYAMKLVSGRTLKRAIEEAGGLARRLALLPSIIALTDAIAYAHARSIIHRDLKPSNVLVGPFGETVVVDWGLAKDLDAPELLDSSVAHKEGETELGTVMGTPPYLSPEQARGHVVDARTDVYALGAIIYELLAGVVPYADVLERGGSREAVEAIRRGPPIPVEALQRGVPRDLLAIVRKAMAPRREDRYPDAAQLVTDLRLFQTGQLVGACEYTTGELVARWLRRHRLPIAVALVATIVLGFVSGSLLRLRARAREEARLAQQLGQDVKEIDSFLRFAYALPTHDLRLEKAVVQDRLQTIAAAVEKGGGAGRGFGHFALGRGRLALHEYDEALRELAAARAEGYDSADLERATGQALGGLYRRGLDESERLADPTARQARRRALETQLLAPALQHLRRASPSSQDQALIAFFEGRFEDAARLSRAAAPRLPWLYEVRQLEGDAEYAMGTAERDRGHDEAALAALGRAAAAYDVACAVARSDAQLHESLAEAWLVAAALEGSYDRDVMGPLDRTMAAADRALAIDPESANALSKKSRAYGLAGRAAARTRRDPRPLLEKAIGFGWEALRLAPHDAITHDAIGNAHAEIGIYQQEHGLDPRPAYMLALAAFQRAIEERPGFAWAWNDMGTAVQGIVEYEAGHGMDYRPGARQAIEHYLRASEADASYAHPYSNVGYAYAFLARHDAELGLDARPDAHRGIAACEQSLHRNPTYPAALINRGHAQLAIAVYEQAAGLDPGPTLARVLESSRLALELAPSNLEGRRIAADAHRIAAEHAFAVHGDPAPELALALDASRATLELAPRSSRDRLLAGRIQLLAARIARRDGGDPAPALRQASASFAEAGNGVDGDAGRAEIALLTAEDALDRGHPAAAAIAEGLAATSQALTVAPRHPRALAIQGALYLLRARTRRDRATAAVEAGYALASLEQALAGHPALEREFGHMSADARALSTQNDGPCELRVGSSSVTLDEGDKVTVKDGTVSKN